jgi:hypothetical protein
MGAKEDTARGTTRWERIRSSTQYELMTLLKKHLQVRLLFSISASISGSFGQTSLSADGSANLSQAT